MTIFIILLSYNKKDGKNPYMMLPIIIIIILVRNLNDLFTTLHLGKKALIMHYLVNINFRFLKKC